MQTQITATVVDGVIKPDQPLSLPNNTRVQVTVEPTEDWRVKMREGLEGMRRLIEEQPMRSGGLRYTRDELHERS
ncbi:MAG: hypothetical protein CMJ64_26895 [Planctomycetaceae bacterium]|jgi:predicted DNA-binding antitoxin AbrB/MazE fold protein|nr:hypothetical protein [Planctomycetaceae bacterium]